MYAGCHRPAETRVTSARLRSYAALMPATDLTWAPMRLADAAAYAELLAAAETVDDTGEHYSAEDLEEELGDPNLDLDRDTWAISQDGRLIAAGGVIGSTTTRETDIVHAFGVVHPDCRRRGIGTRLLALQLERAAALHGERHPTVPGLLSVSVPDHLPGAVALAGTAGLEPTRTFHEMERDLHTEAAEPSGLSAPLRMVSWDPAREDEVRRAHNLAFGEHWGSTERDAQAWAQWFTGSRNFRPELTRLVLDGPGEDAAVVAYLLGYYYEAAQAATGHCDAYIGQLGTLPAARGKGAGTALLTHCLAAYRDLGYDTSSLGVDTANVTNALGLYERVGFVQTRSATNWGRVVPAQPAG